MDLEKFFTQLDNLDFDSDKNFGVKLVYNYFGRLILKKNLKQVDFILQSLIGKDYPSWLVMPFLTLTLPYQDQLSYRNEVLNQVQPKLQKSLTENQYQATMKRLSEKL